MAVYQFYAIIQKDEEDDGYIVNFPDFSLPSETHLWKQ